MGMQNYMQGHYGMQMMAPYMMNYPQMYPNAQGMTQGMQQQAPYQTS